MKNKIISKVTDKMWKRVLIIFCIVFVVIFTMGITSVNYLTDVANNENIHTEIVIVKDKLYGDNPHSDYYLIIGDNNKTYGITNHDGYGQKMFEKIEIGKKYEFIVKEPLTTDINRQTHILRVENVTSQSR